ncbi:MAG: MFS transporter [Alphaproteobacteria bacterium]
MLRIFATMSPLLSAVVLVGLGNGLFFTLLGLRMSAEGVSGGLIGIVGSAYFAGMFTGTLFCERIIRRVGHIRAFSVFASISAAAAILHPLLPDPLVWVLLRFAMGFAMAGYFMVVESWLQFEATNETRGRSFALYILAHTAGAGLGPLLLFIANPGSYELFAIAALLYTLALLPVALTTMSNPVLEPSTRFGIRDLYAISPVAVVGSFTIGLGISSFSALGSVYAERIGLTAAAISFFMVAPRLGGFIMQYPMGILSDRFDRRHVMVALTLATAVVGATLAAVGSVSLIVLLILACLFGAASAPIYSTVVAHANDYVEPRDFVAASAGLIFAHGLGASAGPTLAAGAMGLFGPGGLFIYGAVILVVFAGFVIYRMRRRAPVPRERQGEHVVVTRNAPATTLLDPRVPWDRQRDPVRDSIDRARGNMP